MCPSHQRACSAAFLGNSAIRAVGGTRRFSLVIRQQGLLIALLEERDIGSNLAQAQPPAGGFVQALRDLVRRNSADPGMVRLFATLAAESTDSDHPAHSFFQERYAMVRNAATAGVENERHRGILPPGPDPAHIAASLLAVMDGLQTQWLLDDAFDMVAAFDAHLRAIGARIDER
ncbi:TetR family transcriptional regulator C-terminal domain-containing protein [Streptomyces sp. NBC_00841]|uniref:TetR family transcriptional regulator C-terminal domain-containing protein n=1 Tax=unclassified Streptomyces TaxID=2593676 RepID=UPI002259767A|nr:MULTISPECIES: TetR family transcriptional regulator C-terminal domain-containing protein [unclassified Streptomyces]MCX4536522.1 TetR family transcriptional regulator C-terminal domain-containing protein [Streptomyces sp. NBC_01669]WRZ98247.1 TetR family transcriptional regulator C-terminal domain-containing protein [Streptomyces sp. NBC_00841]